MQPLRITVMQVLEVKPHLPCDLVTPLLGAGFFAFFSLTVPSSDALSEDFFVFFSLAVLSSDVLSADFFAFFSEPVSSCSIPAWGAGSASSADAPTASARMPSGSLP